MLPRLEAQTQLDAINAATIAFGGVKATDRQRYVGRLERIANGEAKPMPASPAALAAMGVAVVVMAPKGGDRG